MATCPGESRHWLELFEASIVNEARVSAATVQAYKLDVANLARWAMGENKPLECLTTADLNSYVAERLAGGANPATLVRYVASWRRFYSYLEKLQVRSGNPVIGMRPLQLIRPQRRPLSDAAVAALLTPPRGDDELHGDRHRAWRDYVIVWLIYATRLSVSRIRELQWSQVADSGHILVPESPEGHQHVRVQPALADALKQLRFSRIHAGPNVEKSELLFPTAAGSVMTRQALWHLVRRWTERAGVGEVVTPTALRRTGMAHQKIRRCVEPTSPVFRRLM